MPGQALGTVRGLPENPNVVEVNVRAAPGTNQALVFKLAVGTAGMPIIEVQPDVEGKNLNGKIYQWFRVQSSMGAGWIRDDLMFIEGDLRFYGYPDLAQREWGFALTRGTPQTVQPMAPVAQPVQPAVVQPTVVQPAVVQPAQPVVVVQPATVTVQPAVVQPAQPAFTPNVVQPAAAVVQPAQPVQASGSLGAAPVAAGTMPDPAVDANEMKRVRRLSFLITGIFEGHGYAAYNNYDAGIVSYGLIQFTLAAGSLVTVVNCYLDRCQSDNANKMRGLQAAINNRDPNLRNDMNFKALLLTAAEEQHMRDAQDEVAGESFWQQVVDGYITPRSMKLPFSYALLFDMGVNFGVNHGFVREAEKQLGVAPRSPVGTNGITEQMLITRVAEMRKASHDRQAQRDNLPGLKVRGDFWMNLALAGDWYMLGDASGNVSVKGKPVNVRNPQ